MPRRGNALSLALGKLVMSLGGWKLEGEIPDHSKMVFIFAPHTSNWDFVIVLAAISVLKLDVRWIGKHTIFRPPFGSLMRRLGGIPIERSTGQGLVGAMVQEFSSRDQLLLGLAPEGTRKAVKKWKSGFYHIAVAAGVPILPVTIDYRRRAMILGPALSPTGKIEDDLAVLREFFRGGVAKHPEGATLPTI